MTLVAGALGVIVAGVPGGMAAVVSVLVLARLPGRGQRLVDPVIVAARLLVLVGSGMALVPALKVAAEGSAAFAEVSEVVRKARRVGAAAALRTASGHLAPLLRSLGEAVATGAAVEPVIRSFIELQRRRRHTEAVERARRLPVKLMIPMTLLVLPGFVLMVYGPALIGLVTDLVGPLTG